MSDTFLENGDCQECSGTDTTGIYQRDSGEVYSTCFKCREYLVLDGPSKGYTPKKRKPKPDYLAEIEQVKGLTFHELSSRNISKEACRRFGVRSILNAEGEDLVHYYPTLNDKNEVIYFKRNTKDKKFVWLTTPKQDKKFLKFFGQDLCGSGGKLIIVTEGQLDTLATYDMLKSVGKKYRVCSINNGVSAAAQSFKDNYEWVSKFETILLAFDQDSPGQKAAGEVAKFFPVNKVKVMKFSEKDPNDMWKAGKAKEFYDSIIAAKSARPDGIVTIEDIYEKAISPPVLGLSWPWDTLTNATYGYRRGEVHGFGAGSGIGKTEGFKEIINHIIHTHNLPVGTIFLEEPAPKTAKVIAGKHANKRFHIPDGDWTKEELISEINFLKDKLFLYDHNGYKNWDSIKSKIRYFANVLGIKDIFLDHLTALVAQEDNEYRTINRIMEEMSSLVQELDCTIFYISHLKKAMGLPHEEGGRVSVDQFRGSGAIAFWSHFLYGYERNQQAEGFEERNTTIFRVLKDRELGLATGLVFKLLYNHDTGRWEEVNEDEFEEL